MKNFHLFKAYGCFGGYVAGNKEAIDCIRSYAPNFIFTSSIPPGIAAGAAASINYLKNHSVIIYIYQSLNNIVQNI